MEWRVSKELRGSEGITWIRDKMLGEFDWSNVAWITAERCRRIRGRTREIERGFLHPHMKGTCKYSDVPSGYRINTSVSQHCRYPTRVRSGQSVRDENEAFVWLVAHQAAQYLIASNQLSEPPDAGSACEVYADTMLETYRCS